MKFSGIVNFWQLSHKKISLNTVISLGQICTFVPQQRRQFVSTQNVPKVVKGKSQGNSKTTFRKKLAFLSREGSLEYRFYKGISTLKDYKGG